MRRSRQILSSLAILVAGCADQGQTRTDIRTADLSVVSHADDNQVAGNQADTDTANPVGESDDSLTETTTTPPDELANGGNGTTTTTTTTTTGTGGGNGTTTTTGPGTGGGNTSTPPNPNGTPPSSNVFAYSSTSLILTVGDSFSGIAPVQAPAPSGVTYSLLPSDNCPSGSLCPSSLPVGLFLNASTGAVTGSPLIETPLSYFQVRAAWNGGTATGSFAVKVDVMPPPDVTLYGYHYRGTQSQIGDVYRFGFASAAPAAANLSAVATVPLFSVNSRATNRCTISLYICSDLRTTYLNGVVTQSTETTWLEPAATGRVLCNARTSSLSLGNGMTETTVRSVKDHVGFSCPAIFAGAKAITDFEQYISWSRNTFAGVSYVFSPTPPGTPYLATFKTMLKNIKIGANLDWTGGKIPGFVIRAQGIEGSPMYFGAANGGSGQFELWVFDTAWRMVGSSPIPGGRTSGKLELSAIDNELFLRFNDGLVIQINDATITSAGDFGIRSLGGTYSALYYSTATDAGNATVPYVSNFATSFDTILGAPHWDRLLGLFSIIGGKAVAANGSMALASLRGVQMFDARLSAKVSWDAGSYPGLFQRKSGTGDENMYLALAYPSTPPEVRLYKHFAGAWSMIGAAPLPAGTTFGVLQFNTFRNRLIVLFNDEQKIDVTDTSIPNAGAVGIRSNGGGIEDFRVGF